MKTAFCSETNEFCIFDQDEKGLFILETGQVKKIGSYWYFVEENKPGTLAKQVCNSFLKMGNTLSGDNAAWNTAARKFKTKKNFDKFVLSLG